jgi:hypothetical protein
VVIKKSASTDTIGHRHKDRHRETKEEQGAMNVDSRRHAEFVKKVGLLRHAKDDAEAGSPESTRGDRLEPCALTVPRGVKLTPFEEQVVAVKRNNPQTVIALNDFREKNVQLF